MSDYELFDIIISLRFDRGHFGIYEEEASEPPQ